MRERVVRVVAGPATGRSAPLDGPVAIGRDPSARLAIDDPGLSRQHAELTPHPDGARVVDLGSSGGTWQGTGRITATTLAPGGVVRVGASAIVVLERAPCRVLATSGVPLVQVAEGATTRVVALTGPTTVGRDPSCDVVVGDASVSRRHLRVEPTDGGVLVEDLGSANGTHLAGERLHGPKLVAPGTELALGHGETTVVVLAPPATEGALALEVQAEGSPSRWAVEVDAAPEVPVQEVCRALADHLRLGAGPHVLYRPADGLLLHPASAWGAAPLQRGDAVVVGLDPDRVHPPAPAAAGPGDAASPEAGPLAARTVVAAAAPRTHFPPAPHPVERPRSPDSVSMRGRGVVWQVAGGSAALLMAVAIVVLRPEFAIFAVIGGVVGVVTIVAGIAGEQSRRRAALRRFRERLAAMDGELDRVRAAQRAALEATYPGPTAALARLGGRGERGLWDRRRDAEDAGWLRLGTGATPTRLDLREVFSSSDGTYDHETTSLLATHRLLDDAPVVWSPSTTPVLGLVGAPGVAARLARWLVVQAAVLHAPSDLRVVVLASSDDWGWVRWLPHASPGGRLTVATRPDHVEELAKEITEDLRARPDRPGTAAGARWLVLVDLVGDPPATLRAMVAAGGPAAFVFLADREGTLGTRVDAVVTCRDDGTGAVAGPFVSSPEGPVALDGLDAPAAGAAARAVGRFRDGAATTRPSGDTGLLDLLRVGPAAQVDVAAAWRDWRADPLAATIGQRTDGRTARVSFRRDGPHGMIAGTTGSGKSELLQSLLASLAVCHPPDALNLFLIDFKGGASFASLARLPHTVGLVTDLEQDSSLAERAFTALDAEMARRKRVLAAAGVADVVAYESLPEALAAPLPSLVVVIDEFALLVRSQPDVRERLDLVATQGRSLGVHLLLATQSPTGVISQAVRTNTNLWLCLRVVDEAESSEILGRKDAARLSGEHPGRGFVRLGAADDIEEFQAVRIARPIGEAGVERTVTVRPFADRRPDGTGAPTTDTAPARRRVTTELAVLVERICTASDEMGVAVPPPLWLPPLPEAVDDDGLEPAATPRDHLVAVLGLADEPSVPAQGPALVDLTAAGHLLVNGTIGAGKTTTLRRVATDLARRHPPHELHVYALDGGGGSLSALAALPHCGGHVGMGDDELVGRLFGRLQRELDQRRDDMLRSGAAGFAARRSLPDPPPWVLLVLDDFPAFKDVADRQVSNELNDRLLRLAQQGPALGLHLVVATAQVMDLRLTMANLFGARVMHRQADAADFAVLGLRLRQDANPALPPGRALTTGPVLVQVALPARAPHADTTGGPPRLRRLPHEVSWSEVAAEAGARPGSAPLGLGGPEAGSVCWDLERDGPHLLVLGEAGTGRSGTLATVAQAMCAQRPGARVVALCPRPSPLRSLAGVEVVGDGERAREVLAELASPTASGPAVLLVDDAEALWPGAVDGLEGLLRDARVHGLVTAVAGRGTDVGRSFEGWVRYLLSLRHGVLLAPQADSGFVFDVRLPPGPPTPAPGRGVLVRRGEVVVLQVARADGAFSAPSAHPEDRGAR